MKDGVKKYTNEERRENKSRKFKTRLNKMFISKNTPIESRSKNERNIETSWRKAKKISWRPPRKSME